MRTILVTTETSKSGGVNGNDVLRFMGANPDVNIIFSGENNVGDWLWVIGLSRERAYISIRRDFSGIVIDFIYRIREGVLDDLTRMYNSGDEFLDSKVDYGFDYVASMGDGPESSRREFCDVELYDLTKASRNYKATFHLRDENIVNSLTSDSLLNFYVAKYTEENRIMRLSNLEKLLAYDDEKITSHILKRSFDADLEGSDIIDYKKPARISAKEGANEKLKALLYEAIEGYDDVYKERMEYELSVIADMGFESYFLHLVDIVEIYRDAGILIGPGRGSAAGSLIAYLLKITAVDPLKYGLLFERFLNPDRISMPDIDIDISAMHRSDINEALKKFYGEKNILKISNFIYRGMRTACLDAIGVLKADKEEKSIFSTYFKESDDISVANVRDYFSRIYSSKETEGLVRLVSALNGRFRQYGVHACGYIINDDESLPLYYNEELEFSFTPFNATQCEDLGHVKIDLLSSKSLDVIERCQTLIEEDTGKKIDIENITLDDANVFNLFARGLTLGVHQFGSRGIKRATRKVGVSSFNDIVAMNALFRPGSLAHISTYANRKEGKQKVSYLFPEMEEVLKETYGITVYQEQVMKLVVILFDFTAAEADILRKAIGKKKEDLMNKMRLLIFERGKKKGMEIKRVKHLWKEWENFGDYAFNKSHAVSYSLLAYWHAWLKCYYPGYFYSVRLNASGDQTEASELLREAIESGIEVEASKFPALRKRCKYDGKIILGLNMFKGFTQRSVEEFLLGEYPATKKTFTFFKRVYPNGSFSCRVIPDKMLKYILLCSKQLEFADTTFIRAMFGKAKKVDVLKYLSGKQLDNFEKIKPLELFNAPNLVEVDLCSPVKLIVDQYRMQGYNDVDYLKESVGFLDHIKSALGVNADIITLSEFRAGKDGIVAGVFYKEDKNKFVKHEKFNLLVGDGFGCRLVIPDKCNVATPLKVGDIVFFKSERNTPYWALEPIYVYRASVHKSERVTIDLREYE